MTRQTAIGMIAIVLWGSILPLIRLAMEDNGVYASTTAVQGIAGLSGLVLLLWRRQFPLSRTPYMTRAFVARLFLYLLHILCLYAAVSIVEKAALPVVIFCNYLWPSLVLLYSIPIARLYVPRPFLLGSGLIVVVVALFLEFGVKGVAHGIDERSYVPIVLALVGANAWGLYSAVTRRFGDSSGGSSVTPVFQLTCAVTAALVGFLSNGVPHLMASLASWPIVLAGLFNFIAYLCWDIGVRGGRIVTLSLVADFIPWLSLATTSVLLGISIDPMTKVSAAVLVVGALITRTGMLKRSDAGR